MPNDSDTVHTDYAQAASELAVRVLRALSGAEHTNQLDAYVDAAADAKTALAAVRILGPDALAAHMINGVALTDAEAAVLTEAGRVYPLDVTADPETAGLTAWRDWATGDAAARCGRPELTVPRPQTPDPRAAEALEVDAEAAPGATPATRTDWRTWSVGMAQLSALALPGLDSPVHEAARRGTLALARAATWAMLRRDHALAAAIGRWLACVRGDTGRTPLDPAPLLEHVLLFGGVDARTVLEAAIGQRLVEGTNA